MALLPIDEVLPLLRCPRCRATLRPAREHLTCTGPGCAYSGARSFPWAGPQPVLIDFDASVFEEEAFLSTAATPYERPLEQSVGLKQSLLQLLLGENQLAEPNARNLVSLAQRLNPNPTVLVIGGGMVGAGEAYLQSHPDVRLLAFDVYASASVQFVADAHRLPLADGAVDAVWIQAVLEHVLEPSRVVAEITRVLKPDGLVYADTPFLQHVHMAAYDFTRFTESGLRWLFRDFTRLESGPVRGPGTVLSWSIEAAVSSVFRSWRAGTLARMLFFWLPWIDRIAAERFAIDTASSFFFLGRKASQPIGYKEAIQSYRGAGG